MLEGIDLDNLVLQLRNGNEEAYETVWRAGKQRLIPYFLKAGFTWAEAQDFWQEWTLKLWSTRCAGYDPAKGPLSGWLFVVGSRIGLDYLRAQKLMPMCSLEEGDSVNSESQTVEISTKKGLRQRALVEKGKSILTKKERSILEMAFGKELPYDVITKRLGISEVAARMRAYRAFWKLWDEIERLEQGELPSRAKGIRRRDPRRDRAKEFV